MGRATTQSTCWRSCTNNRPFSGPKSHKKGKFDLNILMCQFMYVHGEHCICIFLLGRLKTNRVKKITQNLQKGFVTKLKIRPKRSRIPEAIFLSELVGASRINS
jgi:hypothetical protein